MEKTEKKRNIPWGMLYIAATVAAVLIFGAVNREFGNVAANILSLAPGFIALTVLAAAGYFLFEGIVICLLMRSQGIKMSLGSGVKTGLIGVYYSYITPSATGGQPMQAAYLRRDGIPVGASTAVLFVKFICYQCAFCLVSALSLIFMHGKLLAENPEILPFIYVGLAINLGSIAFFSSLFYKPFLKKLCGLAKALIGRIGFLSKRRESLFASVDKFEADFGGYTDNFSSKLRGVALGVLLSVPQFIVQMSAIYFVFRAFGYGDIDYLEVLAVQSLLQVSVSFMPMPGASGAQEIGFSAFFRDYFTADDLYSAVMVWRFFTYYLVVVAGALLVVADQLIYSKKKDRHFPESGDAED